MSKIIVKGGRAELQGLTTIITLANDLVMTPETSPEHPTVEVNGILVSFGALVGWVQRLAVENGRPLVRDVHRCAKCQKTVVWGQMELRHAEKLGVCVCPPEPIGSVSKMAAPKIEAVGKVVNPDDPGWVDRSAEKQQKRNREREGET